MESPGGISVMESQAKSGEICGAYGCKPLKTFSAMYADEGAIYHRITRISKFGNKVATEMSPGDYWVAVQGEKSICFVVRGIAPQKPDPLNIFPFDEPMAVVSVCPDTDDGSGIAASFALFIEKVAIKSLENVLRSGSPLTNAVIVKAATTAFCYLCHDNFKANDYEVILLDKDNRIPMNRDLMLLPCKDFRKSGKFVSSPGQSGYESSDSMNSSECSDSMTLHERKTSVPAPCLDFLRESMKSRCNRETHICCGGWDSRLLKSYGFSWITVQGNDSICVVTQDEVTLAHGLFENVLSHMEDTQLFGFKGFVDQSGKKSSMIRPFAAVSVEVGLQEESGHQRASIAEIKAIEFLMRKIKKASDFTYGGTVQAAISALLFLTQKDLNPGEIKACVLRNGEDKPSRLLTTEIEENLQIITAMSRASVISPRSWKQSNGLTESVQDGGVKMSKCQMMKR